MVRRFSNSLHRASERGLARLPATALAVALVGSLTGCLNTETPIFGSADRTFVPGASGRWALADKPLDAQAGLYVTRMDDGTYQDGLSAIAVPLRANYYLLQAGEKGGDPPQLILVQVLPRYFVVFNVTQEMAQSPANGCGLGFRKKALLAGTDKRKVTACFAELSKTVGSRDVLNVFIRGGGFNGEGRADSRPSQQGDVQKAMAGADQKTVLSNLKYLADRGNANAQLQLARAVAANGATGKLAMEYAKDAYAGGQKEASLLLAENYWKERDLNSALEWTATAWMDRLPQSEAMMKQITAEACATPELRAKQPDPQRCVYLLTKRHLDLENANRAVTASQYAQVEVYLDYQREEKHREDIRREQSELERREQEILLERAKLCAQLPKGDARCKPL